MNKPGHISLIHTTAFRLSLRYAISFCLLTILALLLVYRHVLEEVNTQIDAGLRAEAQSFLFIYDDFPNHDLIQLIKHRSTELSIRATDTGDSGPRLYLLVDAEGDRLAGAMPNWQHALQQQGDSTLTTFQLDTPDFLSHLVEHEPTFRLTTYQIIFDDGLRLLIGQALNEQEELRERLIRLFWIITILMLGAGIIGGCWIGKSVIRSLESVIMAAEKIMQGDLTRRIPARHLSDEFAVLAQHINLMLERIESLMDDLKEVTVNVAHDMRTPLTRIRTQAEAAILRPGTEHYRDALENTVAQSEKLVWMLNATMDIARIEAGKVSSEHQTDLTAVCQGAIDLYEPLAEDKQQQLTHNLTGTPVLLHCNAQLMAQAVGNLLDNAIKYTPVGGAITLSLTQSNHQTTLTLSDTGPGIPLEQRKKATQRFVRLDNSRSLPGNGLGLSLVAAVAASHKGSLQFEDNQPGLTVRLVFNS